MKSRPGLALAATFVLMMPACSGTQWSKPGADAAAIGRDTDECRTLALRRATPPVAPAGTLQGRTDGTRPDVMTPAVGSNERFIAEHEDIRRCMLQRGYQLRPSS